MSTGSKTIADLPEVQILDDKDQFLFFQNSTKKAKRITKGNMANSGGGLRGKFIDASTGNDVGLAAATATINAQLATASAQGAQQSANGKNKIYYLDTQPVNGAVVGSISGTTLNVASVVTPVFSGGQYIYVGSVLSWTGGSGGSDSIRVNGQLTGTTGGVGTYSISATASAPSSTAITANPFSTGDVWFETDQGYKTYKYGVSSWAAYESDGDQVLSGLNVGKLTAGYISGKAIQLSDSAAYIQSSTFIETWTSTRTFKVYVRPKANVSDQDLCKVLQADGTYRIFKCVSLSTNNAPPVSGNNGYWQEVTALTTPSLNSIAPEITVALSTSLDYTFRDLGFRIVGSGSAEFASSVFRGAVVAQEGFFGSTKDAARIDASGLTIGSNGRIMSVGVTHNAASPGAFGGDSGFFLGYAGGQYQFHIGNPSGDYLRWDGSVLKVNGNIVGGSTVGSAPSGVTDGLVINSTIGIRKGSNTGTLTITGGATNGISSGAQIDFGGNSLTNGNRGVLILQGGSAGGVQGDLPADTINNGRIEFRTNTFDGTVGVTRARFNTAGEFIVYRNASSPTSGSLYTDGSGCAEFQSNVGIGRPFLLVNTAGTNTGTVTGHLHVQTEIALYGTSDTQKIILSKNGTSSNEGIITIKNNAGTAKVILSAATGDVSADTFTSSSSKRFKTNIKKLNSGLEIIDKLRPVSFKRKDTKQKDIGLIAEEVDEILPVIVKHNDKNEAEGLDYSKLTVILINAVKELSAEVKELKKKLKDADTN